MNIIHAVKGYRSDQHFMGNLSQLYGVWQLAAYTVSCMGSQCYLPPNTGEHAPP